MFNFLKKFKRNNRFADKKADNIILTDDVQLSLNTAQTGKNLNICVFGGAGTGKTWNYVLPNILQANTSYVITDRDGYLLNKTGKFLKEQGYIIKVLNLNDMTNITEFNLINDMELNLIGDRKTAVFIPLSAFNTALNFRAGIVIAQIFNALYVRTELLPNNKLPVHVRFMLDEFADCGYIPDFEKYIAVCGHFNMSMNIILQCIEQLQTLYKYWDIILGNCDSRLYLGGLNIGTLKHISETVGSQMSVDGLIKINKSQKCVLNVRGLPTVYGKKFDVENHINYDKLEK